MSRVTRAMRGGSRKVTNDDEGEGGVTIPPKYDDVIYEQPLKRVGNTKSSGGQPEIYSNTNTKSSSESEILRPLPSFSCDFQKLSETSL